MLKIQVLGSGLIPRGLGLAPRMTPFNADFALIGTILSTPGLTLRYKNPEDGRLLPLTRQNSKRVWDKYSNWTESKTAVKSAPTAPHVPEIGDENKAPAAPEAKAPEVQKEDAPIVPEVKETETAPAPVAEVPTQEEVKDESPEVPTEPVAEPTPEVKETSGSQLPVFLNDTQQNRNNHNNNHQKHKK